MSATASAAGPAPAPPASRAADGPAPSPGDLAWGRTWPPVEEFRRLAAARRVVPVVRRLLADDMTPVGLYRTLAQGRPGTFILESAETDGTWSRWSFVGVRSHAVLTAQDGRARWSGEVPAGVPRDGDVIEVLARTLEVLGAPPVPGLPPFTGGLVGALGWDVVRAWEPTLPRSAPDDLGLPEVALCLAGDLAVVDHTDGSVWLVATAINGDGTPERVDAAWADAVRRLDALQAQLAHPAPPALARLVDGPEPAVRRRWTAEQFEEAVRTGQQAVRDGEVFQVVVSQRWELDCPTPPIDVYRVLRTLNPSPYMYLVALQDGAGRDFAVVGSSPETLVAVRDGQVTTFPIAGSRPRGATPEEDRALADELLADPKERAEHIMLVDLARNDLAKVCDPATVEVSELMAVKRFSHVMHLCSTVTGRLRPGATALATLMAAFPAGTLSGAPKPRAIALIDELEPTRRGLYGGTVGYLDLAGNMDMAIAIRTVVIRDGRAIVQAGAGVVADSVPAREEAESRAKATAPVRAVQIAARLRPA